jgi:hypothetical protein
MIDSTISECDQKLTALLDDWKVTTFNEVRLDRLRSIRSSNSLALEVHMIRLASIVLPREDFQSPQMLEFFLKMSFCANQSIACEALANCRTLLTNTDFVRVILQCCLWTPESLFVSISLLNEALQRSPVRFTDDLIWDIETIAFVGLSFSHPETRVSSLRLLERIGELSKLSGIAFINGCTKAMEIIVKQKLLRSESRSSVHTGELRFTNVIQSHFFGVWLLFLAEIANVLVAANYVPVLSRMRAISRDDADIGLLILISASHFFFTTPIQLYAVQPYQAYDPWMEDTRPFIHGVFRHVLSRSDAQNAFTLITHVHISLYPLVVGLLSTVALEHVPLAAESLCYILQNPAISATYMHELLPGILSFLAHFQEFLTVAKANGPRVIRWDDAREENVMGMKRLAKQYCLVNSEAFGRLASQIVEDDWSLSSRELAFRFLVNWAITTSPALQDLRDSASAALGAIVQVGSLFSDSLLFDSSAIRLFSSIETAGTPVLSSLLFFHVELLLEIYIEACYVQPRRIADLFFLSIFMAFDMKFIPFLKSLTGQLVLLGLVFERFGHQSAYNFLAALVDLIARTKFDRTALSRQLAFATEAILQAAFDVLKYQKEHVPIQDVLESIRPWIVNLRLLPKQENCVPGISPDYERFTPYQLLDSLMEVTEIVGEDHFSAIASLWAALMKSQYHKELIPIFLCHWKNGKMKSKLFAYLISADAENIVGKLALHCSFAYYYHTNVCLNREWEDELWVIPLIAEAFTKWSDELIQFVPTVIHFAFLGYDAGASRLLSVLCGFFSLKPPDDLDRTESFIGIVRQCASKLSQHSEEYLEQWGTEALKWLLGSQSLRTAYRSLTVYNQIQRPMESLVVTGVCKAVAYHVVNSADDMKTLTDLVGQAFTFYLAVFADNEQYAFSFASAFIDCKVFVDSCLSSAIQLFIKSLNAPRTSKQAWSVMIGIVRPLLSRLETDEPSQHIFQLLIQSSQSQELMMIVAPIKESHPKLFPALPPLDTLLASVSETAMCKSLVHYAVMLDRASSSLLNSIFRISAFVLGRIVNENNRRPLAVIYKYALNNLATCPGAIELISVIAKADATFATKSVYDFYDWDRSLEDVCRSLGRLIVEEETVVTVTDCATIGSVYNFLTCDIVPKILPFVSQREMVEGMMRVTKTRGKKRSSFRRSSHGITRDSITGSRSNLQLCDVATGFAFHVGPLPRPEKLIIGDAAFRPSWEPEVVMSPEEFLLAAE